MYKSPNSHLVNVLVVLIKSIQLSIDLGNTLSLDDLYKIKYQIQRDTSKDDLLRVIKLIDFILLD
jgi:hypothetical protein